jgi:hypothetical protein
MGSCEQGYEPPVSIKKLGITWPIKRLVASTQEPCPTKTAVKSVHFYSCSVLVAMWFSITL